MTCPSCTAAESDPHTGLYHAGCKPCQARAIAGSMEHARARSVGKLTPEYMAVLRENFGDDWEAGHALVKAWARRMAA